MVYLKILIDKKMSNKDNKEKTYKHDRAHVYNTAI